MGSNGASNKGEWVMPQYRILGGVPYFPQERSITLDLAGSGGSIASGSGIPLTIIDHNNNVVTTDNSTFIASFNNPSNPALPTDYCQIATFSLGDYFPGYDGSKDTLEVVMPVESSLSWADNKVGMRLMRFEYPSFADLQQCAAYEEGGNRIIFTYHNSGSTAISVNCGAYDVRRIGAHFSPGSITGGITDVSTTGSTKLTLANTMNRRSINMKDNSASVLSVDANDFWAFGMLMADSTTAATRSIVQSAAGLTFTMDSTTMLVRYIHLHHRKGS